MRTKPLAPFQPLCWLVSAWLIFFPQTLFAQEQATDFWKSQLVALPIERDTQPATLPMLDTVVKDYRFFFVGEEHHKQINSAIQLTFLLYLHRHARVRHLIIEGSYSTGFLINQYLQTGEEGLLRKALTNIPVCPEDQMAIYQQLYAYNQSLPEDQRIEVAGIDLEHSPELALQVLHTLLPAQASQIPAELQAIVTRIEDLHRSPYFYPSEVKRFFQDLRRSFARKPAAHQQLWGAYHDRAQLIVTNVMAGYRFSVIKALIFERVWRRREEQMYANFLALQPHLASGGYFAQFGVLHTDLRNSPQWDFPPLAQRLDQADDSPVRGQVLTFSRYLRDMPARYAVPDEQGLLRRLSLLAQRQYPGQVVLAPIRSQASSFPTLSHSYQYILMIDPRLELKGCQ
jgi:hypothetical protein